MIVKEKIAKIPGWSKNDINRWADYIEFMCLYEKDHLISKDDVLDMFFDGDMGELKRGEVDHSDEYDKIASIIDNYYEIILYRNSMHEKYYPFEIEDGKCIMLKDCLSKEHMHYVFYCFVQIFVFWIGHLFRR